MICPDMTEDRGQVGKLVQAVRPPSLGFSLTNEGKCFMTSSPPEGSVSPSLQL